MGRDIHFFHRFLLHAQIFVIFVSNSSSATQIVIISSSFSNLLLYFAQLFYAISFAFFLFCRLFAKVKTSTVWKRNPVRFRVFQYASVAIGSRCRKATPQQDAPLKNSNSPIARPQRTESIRLNTRSTLEMMFLKAVSGCSKLIRLGNYINKKADDGISLGKVPFMVT